MTISTPHPGDTTNPLATIPTTTYSSAPRRILKRAGNILTSTGQPSIKGLDEILTQNKTSSSNAGSPTFQTTNPNDEMRIGSAPLVGSPLSPLSSSLPASPKLKLSASIKRKFHEVRQSAGALGRSKSVSLGVVGGFGAGAGGSSGFGVDGSGGGGSGGHHGHDGQKRDVKLEIGGDSHPIGNGSGKRNPSPKRKPAGMHARSASYSSTIRPSAHHSASAPARTSMDVLKSVQEAPTTSTLASTTSTTTSTSATATLSTAIVNGNGGTAVHPPTFADITVPLLLQQGTPMTKVSNNKRKKMVFRLDPELGQISWESKQRRIIPIETIKELRSTSDARYYREQFQLAAEYEDRWLTIVYILDGVYKTLHLVADTRDIFKMWDDVLRRMRKELVGGWEVREAIWERRCWGGGVPSSPANGVQEGVSGKGDKLMFGEVERMCKRLNINSSSEELQRLFKQADTQQRNFLDFEDFRRFVKLLKGRPEIDRLFRKARDRGAGAYTSPTSTGTGGKVFDFPVFERFMREKQKSNLTIQELHAVFERYSVPIEVNGTSTTFTSSTSTTPVSPTSSSPSSSSPTSPSSPGSMPRHMTSETFTSFLLSPDNSAFTDNHAKITHTMTHPLSDYYVSSSHNTYLVGHQLVGVSTIEGYIRALLHSCRSVELDIYDGDAEPMIFHGKTFTSKVSLREVCHAIKKYGFVASPYPIIISAEVHCGLAGQDMIAEIMDAVFGEVLVKAPVYGRPKIEHLPSPEELKGRILFKTKNLYIASDRYQGEGDYMSSEISGPTSGSASSTSDSDALFEQTPNRRTNPRRKQSDTVMELKEDLLKRGSSVLQRVRSVGKSASSVSSARSTPLATPPSSPASNLSKLPVPTSPSSRTISSSSDIDSQTFTLRPPPTPYFSQAIHPHPPKAPHPGSPASGYPLSSSPGTPSLSLSSAKPKPKMSLYLLALLVYTVGVKCRGINKKESYAPEHMFSLSETVANKMIKTGIQDLIKHCRTHLVRVYPKGLRLNSTNYEPHRYWSAGAQLVAMNWQTFDLGYMINHAMFQRNGRAGYVLKPPALRGPTTHKDLLSKHTHHHLDVRIISAQQLPRARREVVDKEKERDQAAIDPYVEVSIHVPDWPQPIPGPGQGTGVEPTPVPAATAARTISYRTGVVKNNGFNPMWEETLRIPFDCVGDMRDLIFVRFVVRQGDREDVEPLAVYCASLGSLAHGYRHLPLHDTQLSQYLFSTLFVRIGISDS
ncbi:hypothetical protein BDZ94DRAFT_1260487 [Collybia nuda]|uniref:Phosphoinositide phospholipase C n=1 Tax=Collybia nuda TaxID=64659 RepID=A0A9P6CEH1_9AGAR|nr:hypothetical protein BDZ94DRAFT_1260487 [Collybia nuda]